MPTLRNARFPSGHFPLTTLPEGIGRFKLLFYIMAKSKSFFGLRRGSTKTLTFSVFNGKQVTKDRVESVKNPRSLAQMQQRMVMATASAAYASMKEIVDHSFEGVTYGLNNMSEFIRQNAKAIKVAALNPDTAQFAFNPYKDRSLYGGAFIMSAGSASPIPAKAAFAEGTNDDKTRVTFGVVEAQATSVTANHIYTSLGIAVGDMCTICLIAKNDTDASGIFAFVRLKAKASGAVALTSANYTDYFDVESNLPIAPISFTEGQVTFALDTPGTVEDGDVEYCAIHSVKSNNGWLRSSAVMNVNGYTLAPAYEDAIATYPVGESYVLNGGNIE